jgi:hypothetical protein
MLPQQVLAGVGRPNLVQQLDDPLGITRLPPLHADEVTVVGRIGLRMLRRFRPELVFRCIVWPRLIQP